MLIHQQRELGRVIFLLSSVYLICKVGLRAVRSPRAAVRFKPNHESQPPLQTKRARYTTWSPSLSRRTDWRARRPGCPRLPPTGHARILHHGILSCLLPISEAPQPRGPRSNILRSLFLFLVLISLATNWRPVKWICQEAQCMGQEATARIVQPLYFCLKAKFNHMVGDSRKSSMWIYQWPQTSQIHFIYMSIYLCMRINIYVYIDGAIVLKEKGQSRRAVAISAVSGWPPTTTRSLPGAVVT